ncbi:MAG: hydrogenase maturation protease [Verrucomicrobia bacterium]|jgi:hydrogenase maturation protease|nr:MAG: hydrogenase maturation protease [Verrucomicrobiota bacterium]
MISLIDTTLVGESFAICPPINASDRILVLGVGNLLMGDEGAGVHALRWLEAEPPLAGVRLLDGGTGGANLLGEFEGRRAVILIDATRDGSAAGTVVYRHLQLGRSFDLPPSLSAHDFGLKDLFAAAALIGTLPEIHLYTIAVQTLHPMCTELSPEVEAAIPEVVHSVHALAARLIASLD